MPCLCAPSNLLCYTEKWQPPPSPNPYISEMAFSCRFQKVYTYPPPQVTTCLHMEAKVVEIAEKCQNPESWHIMNIPERHARNTLALTRVQIETQLSYCGLQLGPSWCYVGLEGLKVLRLQPK